MATIIVFERYSPGNSPMTNEIVKKMALEAFQALPALIEKHGIKIVGMWCVLEEQLSIYVYEAPSVDVFRKFMMEPIVMKWVTQVTSEVKVAITTEEVMKLLKE